jgi:cobyrinic acid a,c-diamide synthase
MHLLLVEDNRADARLFAELFDADGNALGPDGGRRGHVTGTFFHAIACEEDVAGQQKIAKLA